MEIDSKPRDFNYMHHKSNFPLEIKGNMRRKNRPQSSGQLKKSQYTHTSSIQDPALVHRIIQNYQDLKSIVPTDHNNQQKKHSIKICNNHQISENGASGAAFLMSKKQEKLHPQKKHIMDKYQFQNAQYASNHRQKRHYMKQKQNKEPVQEVKIPKKHSVTLWKKIDNDLYSNIQGKQNFVSGTVKMSSKNMFQQGIDMGLEQKKQPKMSHAKKREVMGSYALPEPEGAKKYKNQWRRSSIVLG